MITRDRNGFTANGKLAFKFEEPMLIPEELKAIQLRTSALGPLLDVSSENSNSTVRRLQSRIGVAEADLARFMRFDLIRGADDSAPISMFEFSVKVDKLTEYELVLSFDFVHPLSISVGKSPDIMRTTVIDPNLFISKATGKTLVGGVISEIELPRQFPDTESLVKLE